ncbi:hypothetical protein HYFRA_00010177 [Hymenoscyphus fraxineus]|uniref:Uncharacterized protein n=1 Tax=Hymenoscyphus fraxineus TaxID=746836 RepID=A0A9N9KVL1_9HELO|nr:hypothetical protein HYFRA_00010177 [Hymenoscyphus fraxineus]
MLVKEQLLQYSRRLSKNILTQLDADEEAENARGDQASCTQKKLQYRTELQVQTVESLGRD